MSAKITEQSANDTKRFLNLETVVGRNWPTPSASDCKDRGNMGNLSTQRRLSMGKQAGLTTRVKRQGDIGYLNPEWVEWLMGWPVGSTDLQSSALINFPIKDEPEIPRVADKISNHSDKLKALGNGQVPVCAATAFQILSRS